MNITLLAKKGGVGKSTVSLLLYETFRHAGKTVIIHGWDAQGTSTKSLEFIHGSRPDMRSDAEIVIYDTPPNLETHRDRNGGAECGYSSHSGDPGSRRRVGGGGSGPLRSQS